MQRRLLYLQLLIVAIIGFLDIYLGIGKEYFLTVWWWDIILHILGGLWVGLATAWALVSLDKHVHLLLCVAAALTIGIAWEVFEYAAHMGGSIFMSYPLDTTKDILDDSLGGILAWSFVRSMRI